MTGHPLLGQCPDRLTLLPGLHRDPHALGVEAPLFSLCRCRQMTQDLNRLFTLIQTRAGAWSCASCLPRSAGQCWVLEPSLGSTSLLLPCSPGSNRGGRISSSAESPSPTSWAAGVRCWPSLELAWSRLGPALSEPQVLQARVALPGMKSDAEKGPPIGRVAKLGGSVSKSSVLPATKRGASVGSCQRLFLSLGLFFHY